MSHSCIVQEWHSCIVQESRPGASFVLVSLANVAKPRSRCD